MTLELQEPRGEPTRPSCPEDLRHRDAGVVVADPPRYAAEELERLHVAFPKRLRAFPLKGHHKEGVTIRQRHQEELHHAQLAAQPHQRLTKVHLRLTRPMHQRDKHLLALLLSLPHRLLHGGVTAGVALLLQALPNAFGGMSLLTGEFAVGHQDLLNAFPIRSDLELGTGLGLAIPRRRTVCQNLLEGAPVHPRFPENLSLTDTLYQHSSTNLGPLFHIAVHPPVLSGCRTLGPPRSPAALFNRPFHRYRRPREYQNPPPPNRRSRTTTINNTFIIER